MAIQAYEYEKKYNLNLEEFFESAHTVIQNTHLVEILDDIEKLRQK
jgi:hypothetical protein